jgi:hypothetical protein
MSVIPQAEDRRNRRIRGSANKMTVLESPGHLEPVELTGLRSLTVDHPMEVPKNAPAITSESQR